MSKEEIQQPKQSERAAKKRRRMKDRELRKEDAKYRKTHMIRWDKLDNTAHLFPVIAGESMTNVYRISVTLKEEIQKEILQDALDMMLPKFDGFNVRLRQGIFWF